MTQKILNLKLRETASAEAIIIRLTQIPGVVKIKRLFPQEADPELATLYIVTVEPSNAESVIKQLSIDSAVEFAEIPPKRELI